MKLESPAQAKIIPAPGNPADVPAWRQALLRWRAEERLRLGHDDNRRSTIGFRCAVDLDSL